MCHNCQIPGHFAQDCRKSKVNLFRPPRVNFSDGEDPNGYPPSRDW
ncbi:MAG: hypothetical protein GY696_27730 [Gammaproteobacteria bacterium]|nr:hypothetical protein [Gammaproteobacteria bacterium]